MPTHQLRVVQVLNCRDITAIAALGSEGAERPLLVVGTLLFAAAAGYYCSVTCHHGSSSAIPHLTVHCGVTGPSTSTAVLFGGLVQRMQYHLTHEDPENSQVFATPGSIQQ